LWWCLNSEGSHLAEGTGYECPVDGANESVILKRGGPKLGGRQRGDAHVGETLKEGEAWTTVSETPWAHPSGTWKYPKKRTNSRRTHDYRKLGCL
jgi:hypothetical protein